MILLNLQAKLLLPHGLPLKEAHGAPFVMRPLIFKARNGVGLLVNDLVHNFHLPDEGLIKADLGLPHLNQLCDVRFQLLRVYARLLAAPVHRFIPDGRYLLAHWHLGLALVGGRILLEIIRDDCGEGLR